MSAAGATKTINMLAAALWYAEKMQWYVIPLHEPLFDADGRCVGCTCEAWKRKNVDPDYICDTPGKHPRLGDWPNRATIDPAQIRKWWKAWPNANIGIACGPSGLVVVDKDTYQELAGDGTLTIADTQTVTSLTGGGGEHLLYKHPEDGPRINNSDSSLPDWVNIRAWGGQFVAPPSLHPSGERYQWEVDYGPHEHEIAPLPEPLRLLLQTDKPKKAPAIEGTITAGKRHNTLVSYAGTARQRGATESEILALLTAVNQERCQPPKPDTEVAAIAAWAAKQEPGKTIFRSANGHGAVSAAVSSPGDNLQPVTLGEQLPLADIEFIRQCFYREELGDGELFAHIFNGRLVYDHSENSWYLWDGHHWRRDETELIKLLYSGQVAAQYLEGAANLSREAAAVIAAGGQAGDLDTLVTAFTKRARQLQRKNRMTNALDYAASILGVTGDIWDNKPGLLPVANGVVDLRTGELSPGRPKDHIRKFAPTQWQGLDTPCPRFEKFILEIMGGSEDMATFLQRLFGYSISGLCSEHKFPILWGETGRNGKDTLLETLGYVLGPLAGAVTKDVVIDPGGRRYAGAATPHLMELQGKRLVWANEPREGARLDVAQVKWITGGGRLKGRPLHGNEVEWQPTHTVMLVTNPRPHAPADDLALWERILLIPFTQRFVDNPIEANEHKADKGLKDTLKGEAAGILAWLVCGFKEWHKDGLRPSATVTKATAAYRESEDLLAAFIADACIVEAAAEAKASELYKAYVDWCKGEKPMWRNRFAQKMKQRFEHKKETEGNVYKGIRIIPVPVKEDESDNNDRSN